MLVSYNGRLFTKRILFYGACNMHFEQKLRHNKIRVNLRIFLGENHGGFWIHRYKSWYVFQFQQRSENHWVMAKQREQFISIEIKCANRFNLPHLR